MPSIIGEARSGSISITRTNGRNVVRTPFEYIIEADTKDQERLAIATATPGLPTVGSVSALYGMCVGSNGKRRPDNPIIWDWVAEFSTEAEEGSEQPGNVPPTDPTTWVPIAELQYETYSEVFREDVQGKPYVNSANSPFETGLTRERRIVRRDFFQFERGTTLVEDIEGRNETVNETAYKGKAAETLLLRVRGAKYGFYYGQRCWLVDYSLLYRPDGWKLRQLNVGYSYITGGNRKPYYDSDGITVIQGPLKTDGDKTTNQTDDPSIEEFDLYLPIEFNDFLRI